MKELWCSDGRAALVSDVDLVRCSQHRWHVSEANASRKPYVRTSIFTIARKKVTVYLHRFIAGCPSTMKVDHRDNDGLNNQRPNLRIATHAQNNLNRGFWSLTGYKGVSKDGGRYRARITFEERDITVGRFDTPLEAALAYDKAAHELFGEFAWFNFPENHPPPVHDIEEITIPF